MNAASVIVLILLLIGLFLSRPFLTYQIFIFQSLCAMAVLPPTLLGGTSLTPGAVASFFFILRALTRPAIFKNTFASLANFRRLGWLGCFFIVAAVGALVLPKLFAGSIMVFGLRSPYMSSVEPSMTNFTQTGYLFISILMAALTSALLEREPQFSKTLLKAILAGGLAVIVTGFVDIVANASGHTDLLKIFYTADYGYSSGEIAGARRVLGLTPEPATFGGLAMSFSALLLFLRPVYPPHLWRWKVPLVGWGCAVMAFLSASSTAYGSMFVLLCLYFFYRNHFISAAGTLVRKRLTRRAMWFLVFLALFPIAAFLLGDLFASFGDTLDALIFKKHSSSSYIERSSWTYAGLNAFVSSYGLGVGTGSVRTSNFFVNILASTGWPGGVCFFALLRTLYTRHVATCDSKDEAMITAAKFALLPIFAAMFLSGTTPDFGVVVGVLFGVIAGFAARPKQVGTLLTNPKASESVRGSA